MMSRRNNRRWSLTASGRQRRTLKRHHGPPVMWNIQGMRGKMSTNCLWHACQALFVGILLFCAGAVMSFFGFQADGVFNSTNGTASTDRVYYNNDSRANIKFSKLSYGGPIVMGVGGFIIVATCVMTFEARDSAAKVGPAAFTAGRSISDSSYPIITRTAPRSRSVDVRSVASQTMDSTSSLHTLHMFDRKHIIDTFRRFSKTIRTSSSKEDEEFHRSPSAPNLLQNDDGMKGSVPNVSGIAVPRARRSSCLPKLKTRVPPALLRQTLSIDCSSSSECLPNKSGPVSILSNAHGSASTPLGTVTSSKLRKGIFRTITNTSSISENYYNISTCSTDSASASHMSQSVPHSQAASTLSVDRFGGSQSKAHSTSNSGTVDLHLPNGLVTLNVIQSHAMSSSTMSLRTLSPHLPHQSHSEDIPCSTSSMDRVSWKSEINTAPPTKSPMISKSLRGWSESACRPTLTRQPKVDHSEIVCIPDSDDDGIPEEGSDMDDV